MVQSATATNREIASVLREISHRLQRAGADPFRLAAYGRAATFVRNHPVELADIWRERGSAGLRELPGIGRSLASTIASLLRTGRCRRLERLSRLEEEASLIGTLPGVGPTLAARVRETLGSDSLEEVFAAACDGRLRRVAGVGRKRLRSIRECLASRLQVGDAYPAGDFAYEPPIELLLSIDAEYRAKAAAGQLPLSRPRLFNPSGSYWLPVLHTRRGPHRFVAHFANTARSHQLGRFRDWVVIAAESKQEHGQWTVITATRGRLTGKRLVMHREQECRQFYRELAIQQRLPLGLDSKR